MSLMEELAQQPDSLRNLVDYYRHRKDLLDLCGQLPYKRLVLSGMGASYHAAWIASYAYCRMGIQATVVDASDMLHYGYSSPDADALLVLISQSGSSGEVSALLDKLDMRAPVVGITNHEDSILANNAQVCLSMVAGDEGLIASKTYLNTLVLLWVLGRSLTGKLKDKDFDALERTADRVEALLASVQSVRERLVPLLAEHQPIIFLGHGPHAVTARMSAMILGEWAKMPALQYGIGAFRHGFIEVVEDGSGAVVFAPQSSGAQSAWALARDLVGYGARTVVIENGLLREPYDPPLEGSKIEEFLNPVLDIIPVQLAAEVLARSRGFGKGFRYISKVVTQL